MSALPPDQWKGLAQRMREQAHRMDPDKEWVGGAPAQLREAADALDKAAELAAAIEKAGIDVEKLTTWPSCEKCGPAFRIHPNEVDAHKRKWHGEGASHG